MLGMCSNAAVLPPSSPRVVGSRPSTVRPSIFYLFNEESSSDAKLCQELETRLYALYRDDRQTSRWHKVLPGGEIRLERLQRMQEADVILLLLSPDFLGSDDCHERALSAVEERDRGAVVIPVLLRPVASTESLPLDHLQVLPRNKRPVIKWRHRDEAWKHVCEEIRSVVDQSTLRSARNAKHEPGTLVGNYRLVQRIATGGGSIVHEAEHLHFSRRAAIKIARPLGGMERAAAIMRCEADSLAAAAHPGVTGLYDAGFLADGTPYIVMELVRGEDLLSYARRSGVGSPSTARAMAIGRQVAETMSALHGRGIIHCDLKPGNIILRDRDRPRGGHIDPVLIDFGMARLRSASSSMKHRELDEDGIVGTPAYMSPEQVLSPDDVTERSDVYSLGVVLFEMLSGRLPFVRASMAGLFFQLLRQQPPPPPLSSLEPSVPPAVERLVGRMLSEEPQDRPTMREVDDTLHEVLEHRSVSVDPFGDTPDGDVLE